MPGKEHIGLDPELKEKVTPRAKLEEFLDGEKAGSVKVIAVSDFTQRTALECGMLLAEYRGEPIALHVARIALVDEKIRERQFGENANEYIGAYEHFETEIFPLYYSQDRTQRRKQHMHKKYDNEADFEYYVNNSAARNAISDLIEINRAKSKQDNQNLQT